MIENIKKSLEGLKSKRLKIKVDTGRNKMEEYVGFIDKLHKNIWTFKTDNNLKSFSYTDILIGVIKISS